MRVALIGMTSILLAACGGGATDSPPASSSSSAEIQSPATTETVEHPVETQATNETPAVEAPAEGEPTITPEFASLPAPYNTASYSDGKRTYKLCVSCHLMEEGQGHLIGPNLHGLFSRGVGEAEGFDYSDALLEADFQWTPEKVEEWLENPRTFLKGNRMAFSGVRKPSQRTAVTAYMMTESGYEAADE